MTNTTASRRPRATRDHRALSGPIRQFLTDRSLTVTGLADQIGYNRAEVSSAINGAPMTWALGHEIAVALGVRDDAVMELLPDDAQETDQ